MNQYNSIPIMIENEDVNTISQIAIVNNDDVDEEEETDRVDFLENVETQTERDDNGREETSHENSDLELGQVELTPQSTRQQLLDLLRNEIDHHTNRCSPSIYMVPGILRDLSPNSFKPRFVSIGPLHKEDQNLKAFDKRKVSCLNSLLERISNVPKEEMLESCTQKMYDSMERIKACYVFTESNPYDEHEIAKMMVMDACFILEFMKSHSPGGYDQSNLGYELPRTIIFDLVLLENQIPFFVLVQIYECTIQRIQPNVSLVAFIKPLLDELNIFTTNMEINNTSTDATHILSLLRECYKPPRENRPVALSTKINSAVDLDRAGVNFQPNQDSTWKMQMEVKFKRLPCGFGSWCKPILRIPVLQVHDFTEMILRNLIAYEQFCATPTTYYITSYVFAMDMLINSQEDVTKLIDSQVLVNDLGSNKEAANMINNICKNITNLDFFYDQQWKTLKKYSNAYWPKNIVWLKRTYFSSPWNIIALAAGIILFALTVVQTISSIKS